MAKLTQVKVPDIGDFDDVPVIEILVSTGDRVSAEDPLVTLESDKATMDVPAPVAGVVGEIKIAVGDSVSQGTLILYLDEQGEGGGAEAETRSDDAASSVAPASPHGDAATPATPPASSGSAGGSEIQVTVPDIGDFEQIPVIEVLVSEGDHVEAETSLITLESDKATMDVPAPQAGTVKTILVSVGDNLSQGNPILVLETDGETPQSSADSAHDGDQSAPPFKVDAGAEDTADERAAAEQASAPAAGSAGDEDSTPLSEEMTHRYGASEPDPRAPSYRPSPTAAMDEPKNASTFHATPAIRRFARELGVDITRVRGTGRKGRILREDVHTFVKQALAAPSTAAAPDPASAPGPAAAGMGIEPIPAVDFSRFGEVEEYKLPRIKRISGPFLHRAWLNVPHVTHHDEVDVTDMEAFRGSLKKEAEKKGVRVTALTFIMKAVAKTLAEFPNVNSSLGPDGASLVRKKYFHIGIAVDTPNGLVVPVFRDVNLKGIFDLAAEMADVSTRARDGKLKPDEMQGGCFSISSLGGIGGTAFTPIVNAPEVAILGVSRSKMQPVWNGDAFVPRLMLPLDMSYDHRVIDGAEGARFVAHLCGLLGDLRRLML